MKSLPEFKREYKCANIHWKDQKAEWKTIGNVHLGSQLVPRYLCNKCKEEIQTKTSFSIIRRIKLLV